MTSRTYSEIEFKGNLEFGKTQLLTSERMKRSPKLATFIFSLFGYTNIGNWARSKVVIDLFKRLPLHKFKKIMDLGAGWGELSFMLAEALPHARITALEIHDQRVALLKSSIARGKFSNVTVYGDKIETLQETETYDFIFSVDVFEHIEESEMPFKECYSKLKPGGLLMVKMPNVKQKTVLPDSLFEGHNRWLEEAHVGQIYDLKGLEDRFKRENFSIVHSSYSDGWLSRLGWEIGYITKKGGYVTLLLFLPISKLLVQLDRRLLRSSSSGNTIQVIGKKE